MKLGLIVASVILVALSALFVVVYDGGEDVECYPPVTSGEPESAEEHGLLSEECESAP